jgi:hypothetical protein
MMARFKGSRMRAMLKLIVGMLGFRMETLSQVLLVVGS